MNWWMDNDTMVHIHTGILFSFKGNGIQRFESKKKKNTKITLNDVTEYQKSKHSFFFLSFVNSNIQSLDLFKLEYLYKPETWIGSLGDETRSWRRSKSRPKIALIRKYNNWRKDSSEEDNGRVRKGRDWEREISTIGIWKSHVDTYCLRSFHKQYM